MIPLLPLSRLYQACKKLKKRKAITAWDKGPAERQRTLLVITQNNNLYKILLGSE